MNHGFVWFSHGSIRYLDFVANTSWRLRSLERDRCLLLGCLFSFLVSVLFLESSLESLLCFPWAFEGGFFFPFFDFVELDCDKSFLFFVALDFLLFFNESLWLILLDEFFKSCFVVYPPDSGSLVRDNSAIPLFLFTSSCSSSGAKLRLKSIISVISEVAFSNKTSDP